MAESELKRCPFCGGEAILGTWRDEYRRLNPSSVHCSVCHVETKIYPRKKEAIEAWNKRATPEPIRANARREPNLDGKCGSCAHSVTAEGYFGNSKSQVECKNPELQASRRRQDHPLTAVRSRTTKGCKQYKRRKDNA